MRLGTVAAEVESCDEDLGRLVAANLAAPFAILSLSSAYEHKRRAVKSEWTTPVRKQNDTMSKPTATVCEQKKSVRIQNHTVHEQNNSVRKQNYTNH